MGKVILGMSVIWSICQILSIRKRAAAGEIVIPPLVISHFIFTLCVAGVMIWRVSPFHLLWLFFPVFQKITMTFIVILAMTKREQEQEVQILPKGSRKRKGGKSG